MTSLLNPTWGFEKFGQCANVNKICDPVVLPHKSYITFQTGWMALQTGEVCDNVVKQYLTMELNSSFADGSTVNSSLPNCTVASLSGLMEATSNLNGRQSSLSTDVGACEWVNN